MADRLTPLDASFLHTETASAHMHVAWRALPARPVWVDTEHFDVRRHVIALGRDDEPLSHARFDALADTVLSRPLDRMQPLWEIHLAPRLEDGTVGLLMKIHHALVDGKSALAVALLLLDLDPEAPEPPAPPDTLRAGGRPGAARLAVDALVDSGTEPLRALGRAARAAARPAPSSFLNDPIGPRRTLVGHSLPVAELLAVKQVRGVSLNDVALAVVAGALRKLSLLRHVAPAPLR